MHAISLFFFLLLCFFPLHRVHAQNYETPTRVGLLSEERDLARLQPLNGVTNFTIYHAVSALGFYNHHPHIVHYQREFFVCWSSHLIDEDEAGQRVLISRSADGQRWSAPEILFPTIKTTNGKELTLTANGWLIHEGALYAIGDVYEAFGWTDNEGRITSKKQSARYYRTAQRSVGRFARRVANQGKMEEPFWVLNVAPTDDVQPRYPYHAALAKALDGQLQAPLNRRYWQLMDANQLGYWIDRYLTRANDGHYLAEPTTYAARDGLFIRLLRDLDLSHYLYAATSRNGADWTIPTQTNIPDSPALSFAGVLPDGRRYLLNNPLKNSRDPLTLRVSQHGLLFGPAEIIRGNAPPMRHKGLHKSLGFHYPSAVVADSALWIAHSVNKEDIEISRVPLAQFRASQK